MRDEALTVQFQTWIRQRAGEEGLTQQALADRIGVGVDTVRAWWQGRALPNYPAAMRLRAVLGPLPHEEGR